MTHKRTNQHIAFWTLRLLGLLVVAILLWILGFIIYHGAGVINWEFLTTAPTDGMTAGGIFPAIVGTCCLIVGSMIVAFPLGVMSAIYTTEYAGNGKIVRFIRIMTNNLGSIPSIIFGLFGMALFVNALGFGDSIIAGSFTLGLLALPLVIRTTEEALKAVPDSYRTGSLALGASKLQTIWKVVLPSAFPNISTGLIDFEQALAGKIDDIAPNTVILDLSEGVETVAGHCSHGHDGHHHGVDPHIWLSPRIIKQMGGRIATQLQQLHPDSAQVFQQRTEQFVAQIDSLDNHIRQALGGAQRNSFAIGHTSLTYFANDYGLRQIAIENEGKEPSVKAMKQLVDSLQRLGVKGVLYQRQTSDAAAQTIARELPGGHAIEFDPLAPDWLSNMYRLADSLQVILNE